MTSAKDTFKKCSPWIRLSICIKIHVKKALIDVLHNHINEPMVNGLPSDPAGLYTFLKNNENKIRQSKFIKKPEEDILLPAVEQSVDSSSFDVSLTRCLIRTFCGISNSKGNWSEPDATDHTICANVYRAADLRNTIFHGGKIGEINATEFEKKWKQLEEILKGLKYFEDIGPFKTEKLDITKYKDVILEEFNDYLRSYKEECKKEKSQDNYIARRFAVDGKKNNIVKESDLEGLLQDNDCVVIHGEAGMGKSSTARRLKNDWCAKKVFDDKNIIYYDSKKMNKQLTYKSNAAALAFSEMRDHLTKKRGTIEIDDLSIFYCVKTTFDNLIVVIDGIDEFPIKERVTRDYVDELERKVLKNEEISGAETISAIYFGHLFPYSKLILLGRNGEFETLKKVKVKGKAAINNRTTKNLELLKFDDAKIKEFTCLKICKHPSRQNVCNGPCQEIYNKIKNIELCKNPTDLNSLIELQNNKHPDENIRKITRTKLLIATIFNRLTNHIKHQNNFTVETFRERKNEFSKYFQCIRTLGEISFKSLLENNITVQVEEEIDDGIAYFEDKNKIRIERETLEELDLFYVRNLVYYFKLDPHHTLNIEFLSACYLFTHPDEWKSILELKKDRQVEIIKFIAGLHADDNFTKDFVKNVLNTSTYSLEQFFNWLYDVKNVRNSLPDGGDGYNFWFGLMETQKLSPSFFLLDSISLEVKIPQTFIPTKTIVCYSDGLSLSSEWYDMEYLKHNLLTKLSDKLNIESFLKKFPSFKFIVKVDILIIDDDEFNRLNQCGANNLITFRIDTLHIYTSLNTSFSSYFNVNTLNIWSDCGSRTIDMMLNALSPPPTNTSSSNIQPALKCKRLVIYDITLFNPQQTEKVFELCLRGVVDYIKLGFGFFTDGQLAILKKVERKTNTQVNIELWGVDFNDMFGLPNLGNRHVSLNDVNNVTDSGVDKLRYHIPPGYSNNLNKYKIINAKVPFVRKENYSQDSKHSMFLNLYNVDFSKVSPEVFANTFSMIPSLSSKDDDYCIPSSHWLRLSQIDDCRLNEMRIWAPRPENFEYFLNIKTRVSQFICYSKDDLKQLLDYIVNNQDIQFAKQINNKYIKVFVVKVDLDGDWDYYDEITLFSGKTIKEYKDNYSSDNSLLDNIPVSFHDGEQHLKWWCCEISLPFKEKTELCVTILKVPLKKPIVKKLKIVL